MPKLFATYAKVKFTNNFESSFALVNSAHYFILHPVLTKYAKLHSKEDMEHVISHFLVLKFKKFEKPFLFN